MEKEINIVQERKNKGYRTYKKQSYSGKCINFSNQKNYQNRFMKKKIALVSKSTH